MKEIKSKDPLVRRLDLHPTIEARMGQTESPMMNPALLESPIRPTPKPSDPFLKYLTIRIRIEGNANEKPKPAKNLRITRDAKVGASPLRITEIVFTAVPMMTIFPARILRQKYLRELRTLRKREKNWKQEYPVRIRSL